MHSRSEIEYMVLFPVSPTACKEDRQFRKIPCKQASKALFYSPRHRTHPENFPFHQYPATVDPAECCSTYNLVETQPPQFYRMVGKAALLQACSFVFVPFQSLHKKKRHVKPDRTSPPKTFKSFPINDLKVFQKKYFKKNTPSNHTLAHQLQHIL